MDAPEVKNEQQNAKIARGAAKPPPNSDLCFAPAYRGCSRSQPDANSGRFDAKWSSEYACSHQSACHYSSPREPDTITVENTQADGVVTAYLSPTALLTRMPTAEAPGAGVNVRHREIRRAGAAVAADKINVRDRTWGICCGHRRWNVAMLPRALVSFARCRSDFSIHERRAENPAYDLGQALLPSGIADRTSVDGAGRMKNIGSRTCDRNARIRRESLTAK